MEGKRTYKTSDKDFKINAVKLILEDSRSMAKIATELGISSNSLTNWKKEYLKDRDNSFS